MTALIGFAIGFVCGAVALVIATAVVGSGNIEEGRK
jgi:hypothetical protein